MNGEFIMDKFFGTDGVRGIANQELSCELAMNIGQAAGTILSKYCENKPLFLIGKDTRISSDMLENALAAGLCSVGADVVLLGVVPTPAVAVLVKKHKACAGIMISASHNPMEYNGIKIFNQDGYKLPDEIEEKIEKLLITKQFDLASSENLGRISTNSKSVEQYIEHIINAIDNIKNLDFSGIKIAVDCANGSSSSTAKKLFDSLKVNSLIINSSPNGININDRCGSTHMQAISDFVKQNKCDIGFSFDGDADRCLLVDENARVLDGDKILAIIAKYLKNKNLLKKNTLVATVMSNLGLFKMAKANEISIETTKVGDRYVLEKMQKNGYCVGGESSGHIILSDYCTTGDGQLVAVYLLKIFKELGTKISELSEVMTTCPQVLLNVLVPNSEKYNIMQDSEIKQKVDFFEKQLGDNGRILLRPSGTEPLIRVMVEGTDGEQINNIAKELASFVKERFGIQ